VGQVDQVRVMVVDDQRPFREAAVAVLQSMPEFEVVATAASAEAALALVETTRPDLVLMDVVLPELNGLDATRVMRARPEPPVVVLVSTYDAVEFGDDVQRCGASAYLSKSVFGPDELRAVWLRENG
jgi:DNA-binding NarL/FixJ family response regulator